MYVRGKAVYIYIIPYIYTYIPPHIYIYIPYIYNTIYHIIPNTYIIKYVYVNLVLSIPSTGSQESTTNDLGTYPPQISGGLT